MKFVLFKRQTLIPNKTKTTNASFLKSMHQSHVSHESYPFDLALCKRNWILSTDEVHPVLRTKLDSKQNEGYQCINIVYPNENYPFVLGYSEKKLDYIPGQSSYHFNV